MIRCTHQRRVKRSGFGSFEFMAFYLRNSVQKYEVFFIWQKKSANFALFLPFLGVFFYVVGSTSTHINRRAQARKYIFVRAWRVTPELEQRSPCGGASRHRRAKIDTTSSPSNDRDDTTSSQPNGRGDTTSSQPNGRGRSGADGRSGERLCEEGAQRTNAPQGREDKAPDEDGATARPAAQRHILFFLGIVFFLLLIGLLFLSSQRWACCMYKAVTLCGLGERPRAAEKSARSGTRGARRRPTTGRSHYLPPIHGRQYRLERVDLAETCGNR